ncbi:MAG TPA: Clp protease N-terminal domain-containing protein [Anaerolineales bacterium]|nr:Clp protease N-terminal domain-containing protein [Anaerolineales bacterium]
MTTDYLTPDDVASRLQVSRQVVYNWINDGRLRAVKAGRTLRISDSALEAFLQPVRAGDISTDGVEPERSLRFDRFTAAAQAAAEAAFSEVRRRQHTQADVEHVLWVLMQQPDGIVQKVLQKLGIEPRLVEQQLDQALARLPNDPGFEHSPNHLSISARVKNMLDRAEELANLLPDLQIDTSHILQAICEEEGGVSAQILYSMGVTPERLQVVLLDLRTAYPAAAPQAAEGRAEWEQRIEQQLTRIEAELAAIRSMLTRPGSSETL